MNHGVLESQRYESTMLNKESSYLLQIINDFLHVRKTEAVSDCFWDYLVLLAGKHQLLPILFYQCKELMPKSCFLEAKNVYYQQIQRSALMDRSINRFKELLNGIDVCFIKGVQIRNYYPVPSLRTMSDIDVLVREDDLEKVIEIFVKSGAKAGNEKNSFVLDGFTFEFHENPIHSHIEHEAYRLYFDNVWDHISSGILDWNVHFVYLVVHLKNHLVGEGVGLRQFVDIAVIVQRVDLDWDKIKRELKKLKLLDFLSRVLEIINTYFGVGVSNVEYCGVFPEDMQKLISYIISYGVFGNQQENKNNQIAVRMISQHNENKTDGGYLKTRLIYALNSCFPNYSYMCKLDYCNYVNKTKLLLPIAWLHRLQKLLRNKEARNTAVEKILVSNNTIDRKIDEYRLWGLM